MALGEFKLFIGIEEYLHLCSQVDHQLFID